MRDCGLPDVYPALNGLLQWTGGRKEDEQDAKGQPSECNRHPEFGFAKEKPYAAEKQAKNRRPGSGRRDGARLKCQGDNPEYAPGPVVLSCGNFEAPKRE